jgi:uncharacterized damage-inducible protein DinB
MHRILTDHDETNKTMNYSIKRHLAYNLWANQRITEILEPLDESIIFAEMKSSFPGIARTILHIWDAEWIWLTRLKDKPVDLWPSKAFRGTKPELLHGIVNSSQELAEYIEFKGDAFLSETISYKSLKGDTFENKAEDLLMHLVNHGTYHRGQIITMLREQGVSDLKSTDLIAFLRVAGT